MTNSFVKSAMWGSLLHDPQIASVFDADAMMGQYIAFERAWTVALAATGAVDAQAGDAALAAIDAFVPDMALIGQGAAQDGLPIPSLVAQLKAVAPESARSAIHVGATSQDVMDTAMVMACLSVLDDMEARTGAIQERLADLATAHGQNPLMGRTRMQAALPIGVAARIASWQRALAAHMASLSYLRNSIAVVQVGGAVGLRENPAMAEAVAAELGLRVADVWHTDRTRFVDVGNWLVKLSGTLGKIGNDIALMAQQGIDEVQLDGAGGSSAMPHKQNPIRAEVLVALGRYVAGQQGVLAQAMIHEQERSGAAWTLEWLTLPAMLEATGVALNAADQLLGQVRGMGSR